MVIRNYLRPKRRTHDELEDDLTRQLVTVTDPGSDAAEAYRTLRTNLLYAQVDAPPKAIVATSPGFAEGKSTTCANLAVVLAQAEKNVLIVDCDFRNPALHRIFGLRNSRGLVNILAGEHGLQEVWQKTWLPKLKTVTVGPVPPNPAELLSSARFAEFMFRVRREFDYVLFDVPPVDLFADAAVAATQADATLLVLDAQRTRKGDLRRALRSLEAVGAKILGTVMNNAEMPKEEYYSSYAYG